MMTYLIAGIVDKTSRFDAFNSDEGDIHTRSAFPKRPQSPHKRLVA